MPAKSDLVDSWIDLASALGVSRKALQNWNDDPRYQGEIRARRDRLMRGDRHCVSEWKQLMVDLNLKRGYVDVDDEDDGGGIRPPKFGGSLQDWAKAVKAKEFEERSLKVETVKGGLVVASDLEVWIGSLLAVMQMKLQTFPATRAGQLTGIRDRNDVEEKLADEIDAVILEILGTRYLAENAVEQAVQNLPFDEETSRLMDEVSFDGQDRDKLLRLIELTATRALRELGRNAISRAQEVETRGDNQHEEPEDSETSPRNERVPRESSQPSSGPSKKRKSSRPKPTPPPAEMEAAIVPEERR